MPLDGNILKILTQLTGVATDYRLWMYSSSLVDIEEQVKNEILNWSLELERNGIIDSGLLFSDVEKRKAYDTPNIFNF